MKKSLLVFCAVVASLCTGGMKASADIIGAGYCPPNGTFVAGVPQCTVKIDVSGKLLANTNVTAAVNRVQGNINLNGFTLTVGGSTSVAAGSSVTFSGGVINITSGILLGNAAFQGSVHSNSTLDLAGFILTVNGNLIQSGGIMIPNGGRLNVSGDYRIQREIVNTTTGAITYGESTGTLQMTKAQDYVQVAGAFVMRSAYATSNASPIGTAGANIFKAGTLEVKGNFTQVPNNGSSANFAPTGTHKVVLSGTGLQTVNFTYPTLSFFNTLELRNASAAGVAFATDFNVKGNPLATAPNNVASLMTNGHGVQYKKVQPQPKT